MNYTIKTNGEVLTIGTQTFNGNPITLVTVSCISNSIDRQNFFNASVQSKFVLMNKGQIVKCTPIVSRLIQHSIDGLPTDNKDLNQDLGV